TTAVLVPSGGRPLEIDAQLVSEGPMQMEGMVLTQPRPEPPPAEKTEPPVASSQMPSEPKKKPHWWQKKTTVAPEETPPSQPPAPEPAPVEAAAVVPPPPVVIVDKSPRLRIVTDPPGAEVRVDGKVVGNSPVTTGPLDPGPY